MSVKPSPDSFDKSFFKTFEYEKVKIEYSCGVSIPDKHVKICREVMEICEEIYYAVRSGIETEFFSDPGWFVAGGFAAYVDGVTCYYDDINLYIIADGEFSSAGCKFAYKEHFFSVMVLNTDLMWDDTNILPSFDTNIYRRAIYFKNGNLRMYRLRCDREEEMDYRRLVKYLIRMPLEDREKEQVEYKTEKEVDIIDRRIFFMIFDKSGQVLKTVENAMLQNHLSETLKGMVITVINNPFPPEYFGFINYYRGNYYIIGRYNFDDPRLPSLEELKTVYKRYPSIE